MGFPVLNGKTRKMESVSGDSNVRCSNVSEMIRDYYPGSLFTPQFVCVCKKSAYSIQGAEDRFVFQSKAKHIEEPCLSNDQMTLHDGFGCLSLE